MDIEINAVKLFFLGLCIGILVVGSLYVGGYKVCKAGDGAMIKEKGLRYRCIDIEVVEACNIGDDLFTMPEENITEMFKNLNLSPG